MAFGSGLAGQPLYDRAAIAIPSNPVMLVLMKKGPNPSKPRAERMEERTDRTSDCWLWTGAVFAKRGGYGAFYDDDQRLRRAHRVAYEIAHRVELDPSRVGLHLCDTPLCVRPAHLAL